MWCGIFTRLNAACLLSKAENHYHSTSEGESFRVTFTTKKLKDYSLRMVAISEYRYFSFSLDYM